MFTRNKSLLDKIDLGSFKGILIDIDDTMYTYESNHLNAINECYEHAINDFNIQINFESFNKIYRDSRNKVTESLKPLSSCRSRALAFEKLFTFLDIESPYTHAINYEQLYWEYFLSNIVPHDYIVDFLKKCKFQNKLIAAVTDMQYLYQSMKIQKMNLTHLIDFLITSEEAGKEKPNIEIFNLALLKMKLKPNDVIMIGDSYKKDIIGAKNAGIESIHLQI